MNIVVCVKQVPDTSEVRIDPRTNNLVRDGVPSILNPYDENGMELALSLRERHGGTVTAVSMGPPQAARALERCLRMGADDAVLLCDRRVGGSDTLATGYALSELIRRMDYDLVVCGLEAIDGCTAQVGPSIAENLGIVQFTYVTGLEIDGRTLKARRDAGKEIQHYEARLPALVCVLKSINSPRRDGDTDRTVRTVGADDIGLDVGRIGNAGSPTRVVKIRVSNARAKSCVEIDDDLDYEARIQMIIDGGIIKKKVNLWRGSPGEQAKRLVMEPILARHLG